MKCDISNKYVPHFVLFFVMKFFLLFRINYGSRVTKIMNLVKEGNEKNYDNYNKENDIAVIVEKQIETENGNTKMKKNYNTASYAHGSRSA